MRKNERIALLKQAFEEMGITLKKQSVPDIYTFEYKHAKFQLYLEKGAKFFVFSQILIGLDGALSKAQFDTVMDVVVNFHKDYCGDWLEDISFFYSPKYVLDDSVNATFLHNAITEFVEAWHFACANACIVTDTTIFDYFD